VASPLWTALTARWRGDKTALQTPKVVLRPAAEDATLTPEDVKELNRLHLQAGRRVDSLFAGDWRSAIRGRGMEFEEVRTYQPGDDVRTIDWNVTARTGEPFVKVFREERMLTIQLAVDVSGSAQLTGLSGGQDGATHRRRQICRVAGGISFASFRNRDRIGLVTFSDRIEGYLSPRRTRGHTWAVIEAVWLGRAESTHTRIAAIVDHFSKVQRRRAVIVVVSDFFDPTDWDGPFSSMCRKHEVHAVVVTDRTDQLAADPAAGDLGLLEVVDAETGEISLVEPKDLPQMPSADERVARLRRCGARAVAIDTQDDVFHALDQHFRRVGARR
jgi:uncharacterized protein (DUF58 family)